MLLITIAALILSRLLDNTIVLALTIVILFYLKVYFLKGYKNAMDYSKRNKNITIFNIFELISTVLLVFGLNEVPLENYNWVTYVIFGGISIFFYRFAFMNYDKFIYDVVKKSWIK